MRVVNENQKGLRQKYLSGKVEIAPFSENDSQDRSCFYNFGAQYPVRFFGRSDEEGSEFVKSLGKRFFS